MKISVIVPVYQVEPYLKECVDSLLDQDFSDYEILLIDDGSPDHCGDFCDEYAQLDTRVRVFHQKNRGVSAARNLGMEMATGEWLMFVDSDDWLERNALQVLYQKASESPCDIVAASFYRNYLDKEEQAYPENLVQHVYSVRENHQFLFECAIHRAELKKETWLRGPCGKLYRTEHLHTHQIVFPENLKISEDMIFNLLAILYAQRIYLADTPLYHYRMRKSSACHAVCPEELQFRIISYTALHSLMEQYQLTKAIQPCYYRLIISELISFTIKRVRDTTSTSTFHTITHELKQFSDHPQCREAVKNADLNVLTAKRKLIWFLLKWKMYKVLATVCMLYTKLFFKKGPRTKELYWP